MVSIGSEYYLVLAATLVGVYWYITSCHNYWKIRNVPYKKPIPIFGNLLPIVLGDIDIGTYLRKLYQEFEGPYFGIFSLDKPFLVVKNPELIKKIIIKDFSKFQNRHFHNDENIDSVISNVLFGLKGSTWKFLRTKISPVFTSGKMKLMKPLMEKCAENMVTYLDKKTGQIVDTKELSAKYATDVITSCVFGIDANSFSDENSAFREAGRKMFSDGFFRTIQPLAYIFAHKWVKILRLKFVEVEAAQFLRTVFHKTIEQRELIHNKRNDLVDILIELKNQETKDDQFKFEGDRLLAQAIIFFAAGHETTSSTIAFTLYELACNPQLQTRLRSEINGVLVGQKEPTYEAIQGMKFLNTIVLETLRKYPVSPFLQRECEENYLIEDTGLVIEKGVVVIVPLGGLQWDPNYFPEPQKYDPDRFSEENKSSLTPFTYLPFGDGPRSCIGERFGMLNSKLGLFHIIKNFVVEPNAETKIPLEFGRAFLLQSVGGVPLTFKRILH